MIFFAEPSSFLPPQVFKQIDKMYIHNKNIEEVVLFMFYGFRFYQVNNVCKYLKSMWYSEQEFKVEFGELEN